MRGSNRSSWRLPLITLALVPVFIAAKLYDPTKVDKALDDLSRRWVGRGLAAYYYFRLDPAPPPIAIGLFEDTFKREVSKQPPAVEHYAKIIDRLVNFGAIEIVIDMDIRTGCVADPHMDELLAALHRARAAKVPIILPFMPDDEEVCPSEAAGTAVTPSRLITDAAAGRGAVQYIADDATSYYPLYVVYGENDEIRVPSLAWDAYGKLLGLSPQTPDEPGGRNQLNDDLFPAWRWGLSAKGYVFCSFSVRPLLLDVVTGDSSCPSEAAGETKEATGNTSIQHLVKNKVVFLGQAGQSNQDWIETPFDSAQPGVMLHATVLDNLLTFGATGYPVNRDGIGWSFGRLELRMSELYLLVCCLLPFAIKVGGRALAKWRMAQAAGEQIERHAVVLGGLLSAGVLALLPASLAALNGLAVLLSTYVLLLVATAIEELIKHLMERRHA